MPKKCLPSHSRLGVEMTFRLSFALALVAAFAGCRTPPVSEDRAAESARIAEAARSYLDAAVDRGRVSGAVGLVSYGEELAFFGAAGLADRETGFPMTTDTLFRIASMTKPVTSVAVMMLVQEGELSLSDPLSRFIPEFSQPRVLSESAEGGSVSAEEAITIHHLLTHTSGLGYRFMIGEPLASAYRSLDISDGLWPADELVGSAMRRLAEAPLAHEPGAAWTYGLSTDVLGAVIEVVSGESLDVFFQENIFGPLGMTDTHFYLPADKASRLAALYRWAPSEPLSEIAGDVELGDLRFSARAHIDGPTTYFSGGGGLVSSTSDYFRFARMLARGGVLDGVRLLEEETVAEMTRNQIGDLALGDGSKFGLGLAVTSADPDRTSFGWGGFYHTRFWINREHDLIGIFMAQLLPEEAAVHSGFQAAIEDALSPAR